MDTELAAMPSSPAQSEQLSGINGREQHHLLQGYLPTAIYAVILGLAFFLLLYNLDGRLLWGDEAETATLAKNVVRYGIPKTFDGVNRLTLYGAARDSNQNDIWIWSPWLQEYVAAAAFCVLGPTTFASRVLFAFVGWLSLGLLARIVFKVYRDHRIAVAALILMMSSEVFLLHCRQCRYYSISIFGELVLIYGVHQLLDGERNGGWSIALALLLQFYNNYIFAAANVPALLALGWVLYRRSKRSMLPLAMGLAVAGLGALPWVFYAHMWRQYGTTSHSHLGLKAYLYLREYHFHFMPLPFLLLPAGAWLARWWRARRRGQAEPGGPPSPDTAGALLGPEGLSHPRVRTVSRFEGLLVLSLPLYIGVIVSAPGEFTRYLLPMLPVGCVLMAAWVFRYIKWRPLTLGLLAAQCATNVLPLATGYPWRAMHTFRLPFLEYCQGLTHPYRDRLADALDFLNAETRPGQTVLATNPEFPVIFYTRLKVVNSRFISVLRAPLPDWMFLDSPSSAFEQDRGRFPDELIPYYEPVSFVVHASPMAASIPDPDAFCYDVSSKQALFTIYKKKVGAP